MAEPFTGEIKMFGGNFAPVGYALCQGQLLPIDQHSDLFTLIGTTYGGDGVTTFALPDLQGRIPIHQDSTFVMGERAGTENETLRVTQIPLHTHAAKASSAAGTQLTPVSAVWANVSLNPYSATNPPPATMNLNALGIAGGGQPHTNLMPFLVINFIIALAGVFPSRN